MVGASNLTPSVESEQDLGWIPKFAAMNNNVLTVLFCLAFAGIGFAIGRVTAPHSCSMHRGATRAHVLHDEAVEVIVAEASDSVVVIPGGEVTWVQDGDEIRVNVEIDEDGEGRRIIERRVVVED